MVSVVPDELKRRYPGYEEYNETDLYVSKAALNGYLIRFETNELEIVARENGDKIVDDMEKQEKMFSKRSRTN